MPYAYYGCLSIPITAFFSRLDKCEDEHECHQLIMIYIARSNVVLGNSFLHSKLIRAFEERVDNFHQSSEKLTLLSISILDLYYS